MHFFWLLRTDTHRDEVAWFNPDDPAIDDERSGERVVDAAPLTAPGSTRPLTTGRPGTLAAAVLGSLEEKAGPRDRARAQQILRKAGVSRRVIAAMQWSQFTKDTTAIRRQLAQWFSEGRVKWHPLYSGLEEDDRPSSEIPTDLVERIHWRGPSDVALDSFGAAVLASAINGVFARTLYACLECRELKTRDTRGPSLRRRRCDECKRRWRSRIDSGALNIAARRVRDRIRHQGKTLDQRYNVTEAIRRIRAKARTRYLSEDDAIKQIDNLVSRSPRGRPRTKA